MMSYEPLEWEQFESAASELGVTLTSSQTDSLRRMLELLRASNEFASLMSRAGLANVLRMHVFDSLTLLPLIRGRGLADGRLADVGTGGGFPGLVLKIAEPSLGVLLMDATRKKTDYLERTATELELDVEVRQARAEDAGHDLALRESFDIVTCRAIGPWPVVLELALPFCKTGGVVLAQRGAESPREAAVYAAATATLGGRVASVEQVGTSVGLDARHVITVEKVAPTPVRYPRKAGIPEKRPLS